MPIELEQRSVYPGHSSTPGSTSEAQLLPAARSGWLEPHDETCLHRSRFVLQWHITERCNLRCSHCYQGLEPTPELPFGELLRILEQFKQLLARLETQRKASIQAQVNVTGGEPLVRQDFFDLLRVLSAEKPQIRFGILTNGSLISDKVAMRLRELGPARVQVSVEGKQPTHDSVRGKGDFERTVEAVRRLKRHGIHTAISFTAHRLNYREFPEVAKIGRKLGADRVWSDRLIPIGRGSDFQTLTPHETREFFRLMRCARDEAERAWFCQTEVAMHRALQFLEGGRAYHCAAGGNLMVLLPNGDALPCRRMPIVVGNATRQPLDQIYFESPMLRALRDGARVAEGCEGCRFEPHCRGGLRCLAYAMTRNPFRADPGCWLARPLPLQASPAAPIDR